MSQSRLRKKLHTSTRKKKFSSNTELKQCLKNMGLDFECAVAVWLQDLREMSNEVAAFLSLKAREMGCVSRCIKRSMKVREIGAVFLFPNKLLAQQFLALLNNNEPPYNYYLFKAMNIGSYLQLIVDIEQELIQIANNNFPPASTIIIRNLQPLRKVIKRVIECCKVFGETIDHEEYQDIGGNFKFWHLTVSYKFAVQAFAAQVGLDGKWIRQQDHPLAVELLQDEKIKSIAKELLKRNKMLFQP